MCPTSLHAVLRHLIMIIIALGLKGCSGEGPDAVDSRDAIAGGLRGGVEGNLIGRVDKIVSIYYLTRSESRKREQSDYRVTTSSLATCLIPSRSSERNRKIELNRMAFDATHLRVVLPVRDLNVQATNESKRHMCLFLLHYH
jgi:hypothetical protein